MRQYGDRQILYSDADLARSKENDMFNIEIYNPPTGSNPETNEPWRAKEKFVRNLQINFGPQHPAAHGVLRYVLVHSCDWNLKQPLETGIFTNNVFKTI